MWSIPPQRFGVKYELKIWWIIHPVNLYDSWSVVVKSSKCSHVYSLGLLGLRSYHPQLLHFTHKITQVWTMRNWSDFYLGAPTASFSLILDDFSKSFAESQEIRAASLPPVTSVPSEGHVITIQIVKTYKLQKRKTVIMKIFSPINIFLLVWVGTISGTWC